MDMGLDSRRLRSHSQPHPQPQRQSQSQRQPQAQQQQQQQQPLVPVTSASIMNLRRLGINSAASASASTLPSSSMPAPGPPAGTGGRTRSSRAQAKDSGGGIDITTRSTARGGKRSSIAPSPILKPILPAGNLDPGMPPNSSSPATPLALKPATPGFIVAANSMNVGTLSVAGPPMQVRKTSHKAAEQKRRDSLKTTFDDLRKLLLPIALPTDTDPADATATASPLFLPTVPLLPGALPPRGPPKAGGQGPNKGVSKLQLLICGNGFIRVLKARVERRDDEIEKLRREARRLRGLVGEGGGCCENGQGDEVDLQRDLDACERVGMSAGERKDKENGMAGGKSNGKASTSRGGRSNLDDDLMDEDGDGEGG